MLSASEESEDNEEEKEKEVQGNRSRGGRKGKRGKSYGHNVSLEACIRLSCPHCELSLAAQLLQTKICVVQTPCAALHAARQPLFPPLTHTHTHHHHHHHHHHLLQFVLSALAAREPMDVALDSAATRWRDSNVGASSFILRLLTWSPWLPCTGNTTILPNATVADGAMCLDGTPGGYHIQHKDNSAWTIHIQGGGWCTSVADCGNRAHTMLGSSKDYISDMDGILHGFDGGAHGIFSSDENVNPRFFNHTKVRTKSNS